MSFRNLIAYLDPTYDNAYPLDLAVALAKDHQAHLTGLSIGVLPFVPSYMMGNIPIPEEVMKGSREESRQHAEAALASFEVAAQREGLESTSRALVCDGISVASTIGLCARYSDLLILGHSTPIGLTSGDRLVAEDVLLGAGRPVLLVPRTGPSPALPKRVLVAWDAGREATRAVNDALPLLERAEEVTLVVVDPEPAPYGHGEEPGADIALHLARHQVPTEVVTLGSSGLSTGRAILSTATDRKSDLLVMGGYGHSRMREIMLGGVTLTVLEDMTLPVLMSN